MSAPAVVAPWAPCEEMVKNVAPLQCGRMAPFDLTGHVALVTGGNSGIGLGMARGLAEAGADIAIWGTNESKNEAAAKDLEAYGTKVAAFRCDVGDERQVEDAFAATIDALGQVDSCFANAGVGGAAPSFMEMTADEWHRVLRVNLDGVFYTCRAAAAVWSASPAWPRWRANRGASTTRQPKAASSPS